MVDGDPLGLGDLEHVAQRVHERREQRERDRERHPSRHLKSMPLYRALMSWVISSFFRFGLGSFRPAAVHFHAVWLVGFRDLQWRRRRFLIAVLATSLLFSVTLLLSGISAFFHNEARRTMRELDADTWIVPTGTVGPFTSASLFPASEAAEDRRAFPASSAPTPSCCSTRPSDFRSRRSEVIGYAPGGVGQPRVTDGRLPPRSATRSWSTDRSVERDRRHGRAGPAQVPHRRHGQGDHLPRRYPAAFISIADAQRLLLDGAPLATAIVTRGTPTGALPTGYSRSSNDAVRSDLARPDRERGQTIGFINILLWIIAAGIIAAILYMSALERVREFAVIKAMGAAEPLRRRRAGQPGRRAVARGRDRRVRHWRC